MGLTIRLYFILGLLIFVAEGTKGRDDEELPKLIQFRNYMLEEVNFARTHPARYAEMRLKENWDKSTDNGSYASLKRMSPVNALSLHEILNSVALKYANLLAKRNQFSHTADGTPFTRIKKGGYFGNATAENIACGTAPQYDAMINPQSCAIEFVKMLIIDTGIKDVGHRRNLLNPVYRSVGFGFGHNPSSACVNYIVQDFGNP
jgi:hypothetical protein